MIENDPGKYYPYGKYGGHLNAKGYFLLAELIKEKLGETSHW